MESTSSSVATFCVDRRGESGHEQVRDAPRSPSYFGISYSRIAWLRNVFQVSSRHHAMVLVPVVRGSASGSRSGATRPCSASNASLMLGAAVREVAAAEVENFDARDRRRCRSSAAAAARVSRSRTLRRRRTPPRRSAAPDSACAARRACRRSRSRCRRSARRGRGPCRPRANRA